MEAILNYNIFTLLPMYLHCDCIICYTTSTILIWDTGAFLEESVILFIYLPTKFKSKYIVQFQDFNIITQNIMKLQTLRVFSHIHCCVKVRCINLYKISGIITCSCLQHIKLFHMATRRTMNLSEWLVIWNAVVKKITFNQLQQFLQQRNQVPWTLNDVYGIPY